MEQELIALKLEGIYKEFNIPERVKNTLVDYLKSPFKNTNYTCLKVLKNFNLTVNKGEVVGVIGSNGSGKSTLLKIIAGVYKPTSGNVVVNGNLIPFLELGVGFNPELTGRENVYLNGIILGMRKKFLEDNYDEIVKFAELEHFMDLPLKNYSSGMQVRLAFSIAIKADADIYLLDEVLAVGDQKFQEKCFNSFKELKNKGKTIVLVTHSLTAVQSNCTRAVYLKNGIIDMDGEPNMVIAKYITDIN